MVEHPHFGFTRAITIRARSAEIYPWLVQIWWGRAGWYSYDVLDKLGKRSAEGLVLELCQRRLKTDPGASGGF